MQLQLNQHIAFELQPCAPIRKTGYKRIESEWNWAAVVGVSAPMKTKGDKSCFVAKHPSGVSEVLGVLSESTGKSYRGLDTPFALYVLWKLQTRGRVVATIRAYRNPQLDPVNGDCGYLVFDTLEMSDDKKYSYEALAELELCFHRTRAELESWIRKVYHKRGRQLAFVTHDLWRKALEAKFEAELAGFTLTQVGTVDPTLLRADGDSQYKLGSAVLDTELVSVVPGFGRLEGSNRSLLGGVLCDSDGQVVGSTGLLVQGN